MSQPDPERVAFEAKIAFLERAVEMINGVVQEQARSIYDLENRIKKLESELHQKAEQAENPMRPHDDPPPHY